MYIFILHCKVLAIILSAFLIFSYIDSGKHIKYQNDILKLLRCMQSMQSACTEYSKSKRYFDWHGTLIFRYLDSGVPSTHTYSTILSLSTLLISLISERTVVSAVCLFYSIFLVLR